MTALSAPAAATPRFNETSAKRLVEVIRGTDRAVVALSGGVDSSLVAQVARATLGPERVLAVTGVSRSLSTEEHSDIVDFCAAHDIGHRNMTTDELSLPAYQKNAPDRCFHCKNELYGKLRALADAEGYDSVFDGTHSEDLKGHRPSLKAARQHRITSPLVVAGYTKADVRAHAASLGLAMAQRPAQPCLSSRIAYGLSVDEKRLSQVEEAERALRELGFPVLRVRHHDAIARIEVPLAEFPQVLQSREAIVDAVKAVGFTYVTLDLKGFRSGSLLEVLNNRGTAS